jgi:hypothetical protein
MPVFRLIPNRIRLHFTGRPARTRPDGRSISR